MLAGSWSGMRVVARVLPEPVVLALFAAQLAVVIYWLLFALRAAARAAWGGLRGLFHRHPSVEPAPAAEAPPDLDRRRLVTSAVVLPALAIGGSASGVLASRQTPVVTRIALPVRRELTHLHGLTIAQLSDVHVGSYMDAERLDELRDAVNALRPDLVVVTGDLLDNHVDQLELSARLVRGLAPRRAEVFLCMGNHEYIAARTADVRTIVRGLEDAGGQVLVDDGRMVRIGGDHLWLGAIDHPSRSGRRNDPRSDRPVRSTQESLDLALAAMQDDGAPRILLSHHPRTFVEGREAPIDLMLSGHTHGGQIELGRIGDRAITPVLPMEFYHNGLYQHRGRRLYVNAGAGGWLPFRVNCPPEITFVTLTAA
jgi:hypothetical protein